MGIAPIGVGKMGMALRYGGRGDRRNEEALGGGLGKWFSNCKPMGDACGGGVGGRSGFWKTIYGAESIRSLR
jgi:hypothetical protein